MTLNKVPNTDDLNRLNLAWRRSWSWAGSNEADIKSAYPYLFFNSSTNGSVTHSAKRAVLSTDGTDGETASAAYAEQSPGVPEGGLFIFRTGYQLNTSTPSDAEMQVGIQRSPSSSGVDASSQATLHLHTEEAVVVTKAGSKTAVDVSGQLDKAAGRTYDLTVVVDMDAASTEFYIDKSPLVDSPDATIDDLPGGFFNNRIQENTCAIRGAGSGDDGSDELRAVYGEVMKIL